VNDAGSAMAGQAPERLRYLAILPLQDVDRSLAELSRIAGDSALAGLFVGSHVNGMSIANARFDPIVAEAERLGLFIFVHGIRPAGGERLEGGPLLNAAIGIPHENSCAVASFMMRDVLGRHPALKLVFSHGGGGIGAVIDRLSLIWSEFAQMRTALAMPPIDYARRFQYDTAVFGVDYVRYLVARFGAQAIVAGTDGPTEIGQKDLAGFLARAGLEGHELEAVAGGNAAALIGMKKTGRREPAIA
jgi:aminocarboxymuconate-semialdehyde decarboxylase